MSGHNTYDKVVPAGEMSYKPGMTEWLPQITATTPHDQILMRPSALNPYPERITDGTFEVTAGLGCRMPTPRSNFHIYVRYGDGDIVRGQMPTLFPVTHDMMQPPSPVDATEDARWLPLTEETNFAPVGEALLREAPLLASRYLRQRHHGEVQRTYGQVVEWNAELPHVAKYFGNIINTHQEQIAAERPGVALAVAKAVFANAIVINGERVPLDWYPGARREALADLVAPGIKLARHRISDDEYMADPRRDDELQGLSFNIARDAADIFEGHLAQAAVAAAIEIEPPIVVEKLRALEADEARMVRRSTEALLGKVAAIPEDVRTPADMTASIAPTEVPAWLVQAVLAKTDR